MKKHSISQFIVAALLTLTAGAAFSQPQKIQESPDRGGKITLIKEEDGNMYKKFRECIMMLNGEENLKMITEMTDYVYRATVRVKDGANYFPEDLKTHQCHESMYIRFLILLKVENQFSWEELKTTPAYKANLSK